MSHVQALIISKEYFNQQQAEQWAKKHGFKAIKKTHETPCTYRIRIRQPNEKYDYRVKRLTTGVKAVIGFKNYSIV